MPLVSPLGSVRIPEDLSFPDLILQRVHQYSSRTAFIDCSTEEQTSFGEFGRRVLCVAASLWARGVRHGDVIFFLSSNLVDVLVAYVAVTKIGAIVASVNHLSSQGELEKYLDDCRPTQLFVHEDLTQHMLAAAATYGRIQQIYIFGTHAGYVPFCDLLEGDPDAVPEVLIDPMRDLSAILYSSGTTGFPKGVMLTHHAQIGFVFLTDHADLTIKHPDGEPSCMLSVFPFYHASGVILSVACLCNGDTSILMARFDVIKFLEAIQKYKPRLLPCVPPIVVLLTKHPAVANYDLTSVKEIVVGAAPLGQELEQLAMERLELDRIRQGYGMTETGACTHLCPKSSSKPGSIGILLPGLQVKVMDPESEQELGEGQDGELWLRGPTIMSGYLNRPDATANMVMADGWLRTGDIGHYDEDQFFFITDRLKELIKYNGHQVAPAELEALLLQQEAVADVAVVGVPDEAAGELPRAYIVLRAGVTTTQAELLKFVADNVSPVKKLRGGIKFVDAIPKSPTGKILRRILRDWVTQGKGQVDGDGTDVGHRDLMRPRTE